MISTRNIIISTIEKIIIVNGGGQNFMLLSYWPSVANKNILTKKMNKEIPKKKKTMLIV